MGLYKYYVGWWFFDLFEAISTQGNNFGMCCITKVIY